MSNYCVQEDQNLRYYASFTYMSDDNENTIHRDDHSTMDDNWYWLNDGTGSRNTFLLMPAQQDSGGTIWYYVFTTSTDSHDCWGIDNDEKAKLRDHSFTGEDNQKFCFEDAGDGMIHIRNKGTSMYLYRSDDTYEKHHPIRQNKSATSDKHKFRLTFALDTPVYMPSTSGAVITDENELYNVRLLGPVPVPPAYNEVPPPPPKVVIGETLLPFFNVSSDPDMIGNNLRKWQVMNRPYYRFRREQQIQVGENYNLEPPLKEEHEWSVQCGMSDEKTDTFTGKISLQAGFTEDKTAGFQFMGITATSSRGFSLQWELELTLTVSETLMHTETWSESGRFVLDAEEETTYVKWQACDIWTLFYDDYQNRTNNDENPDCWILPSERTFSSKFPEA